MLSTGVGKAQAAKKRRHFSGTQEIRAKKVLARMTAV